jgi:antitoxin component YwqK of YwqJK toxin-antitoxin module
MKNFSLIFTVITLLLFSCKEEIKEEKKAPENLISIKNGVFTQYYPGKKHIKFQGAQDEKGNRNGKWIFKNEQGVELSVTMYDHGKKHGHSIVKYPNGSLYYVGEYFQDKKIGLWRVYDENGKLTEEKDFGPAE